ncbi:EAL and HDOD domain-containing protein [Ilumatobacter sp.]|uniref:EAL and HDOD domain-containing protein n=1 Tax=Ilumatobacter sp. TaxID=1967498 RepID=UPI003B5243FA
MTETQTIFLGRQPILDSDRRTFGHELTYVESRADAPGLEQPENAGQLVMQHALLDWGMQTIVGDRFGLISTTIEEIEAGIFRALPPEGVILEIDVRRLREAHDPSVVDEARASGYAMALDHIGSIDDVVGNPHLRSASLVKIDVTAVDDPELSEIVAHMRDAAPNVLLLADGVQTMETFARCEDAGFDLFQGFFFSEPEVLSKEMRPTGSAAAIKLVAEMQSSDLGVDRAEQLVASDPTLAYRLLSVVNSSAFGLDRQVDSLRHAIVLLGMTQVRNLAVLLTISTSSSASEELIALGATRARFAAGMQSTRERSDRAFTVGLLSVSDAIFATPMSELVEHLPVAEEISDALVHGSGELGSTLALARACESSDVEALNELRPDGAGEVMAAYLEATAWADEIRQEIPATRRQTSFVVPTLPPPAFPPPTGTAIPPSPVAPRPVAGPVGVSS